jgi:hypothetical protein
VIEHGQNRDIALKAWDVYQNLAREMGESAWRIRSVCLTLSGALVAYSYSERTPDLYLSVTLLSVLFCLMESGYRRLQDQYIGKSIAIEQTLDDFIANEKSPRFPDSIGTALNTPSWSELGRLFQLKRAMFWLPYAIMFVVPMILWHFGIQRLAE